MGIRQRGADAEPPASQTDGTRQENCSRSTKVHRFILRCAPSIGNRCYHNWQTALLFIFVTNDTEAGALQVLRQLLVQHRWALIEKPERIEAHLFVAFLAYCLSITLRQQLRGLAGGLMPRTIFEKLATLQMLDVRVPTTDGRELLLVRRTEPSADVALVLQQLGLTLPAQPHPHSGDRKRGHVGPISGMLERWINDLRV